MSEVYVVFQNWGGPRDHWRRRDIYDNFEGARDRIESIIKTALHESEFAIVQWRNAQSVPHKRTLGRRQFEALGGQIKYGPIVVAGRVRSGAHA